MAIRSENFLVQVTVFISYRIGVPFTHENGMKLIGLARSLVNREPIRYEMEKVSQM